MSQMHHSKDFDRQIQPNSTPPPAGVRRSTGAAHRPIGLSMLAVAASAIGVALLLWAGAWFGAPDIDPGSRLAIVARAIGLALVIMAVLELVLAYGVWERREWAWPLGVGLTVTALVLTLLSAGRGPSGAHTMSLLLEIGTLWYLMSPPVHQAFRSHAGKGA